MPIELTNEDIGNSNAYKEYYAAATGATPPKPKASVQKTRSSSDTTVTPLTAAAGPRLLKANNQLQPLKLRAQAKNDEFLKTINENMKKIIKEKVKEQVKVQVSKILPKIEQTVNEQLEAEVLTWSYNSSKTSYAVATDLSEIELKKILIEKMEGNKSIQRSNKQMNLYKALVKAYESDKIILDTYGDTVTLKRRRDNDADKDEEPSAGSDRGPRYVEKEKSLKEPLQTTFKIEEPSHPEFEAGVDDQPIKKLNLTKPDTYSSDLKRKEAYIAYSNPRGFIYQNKDKKNRLMRINELYKFSDGTLTDVRTALDDRLKGIRMKYLP
nr:hypothetical protein [Tanacetum cinerariifolium]